MLSTANVAALFAKEPSRGWGWHPGSVPVRGEPVTFEVDLERAIWGRSDFVRVVQGAADLDLTQPHGLLVVPDVRVPWEPGPLTLAASLGPDLALVEVAFRDFRKREAADCDPARGFCHCRFFGTLDRGAEEGACRGGRRCGCRGRRCGCGRRRVG